MLMTPFHSQALAIKAEREGSSTDLDGRDVRQGGQVLRVGDGRDELDGRHGGAGGATVGAGHGGRGGAGGVDGGVVHGDHREGPGVAGVGVLGRQRHHAGSRGHRGCHRNAAPGRDPRLTLTASTAPASTEGRATDTLLHLERKKNTLCGSILNRQHSFHQIVVVFS